MKLLLAISILFLTGCTNHNLLVRIAQVEAERDMARAKVVEVKRESDQLMQLLLKLYSKYKEINPRQLSN